jgi:hypothetical protein
MLLCSHNWTGLHGCTQTPSRLVAVILAVAAGLLHTQLDKLYSIRQKL